MLNEPVTIMLDKERSLRLTLKGMLEFEKITGKNLLKGFNLKDLSMSDSAALMFACLVHEDKELTYDDVLCMVDVGNISKVSDAVSKCINQSLAEATDNRPLVEKPPSG